MFKKKTTSQSSILKNLLAEERGMGYKRFINRSRILRLNR